MVRYEASYYTVVNGRVQFPVAEHPPLEGPLGFHDDKGCTRDPRVWHGKQHGGALTLHQESRRRKQFSEFLLSLRVTSRVPLFRLFREVTILQGVTIYF